MTQDNQEIYSKAVRAGKRTYFFDVRATKGNDLFLTITESIKSDADENGTYKKHKIFVYKEDFEKFKEGFEDAIGEIEKIKNN